jgi:hypothetical protein
MENIKIYIVFFLVFLSQYAFAQLDSVSYLFKTNPFAQFSGEMNWSIEKPIKPGISIDVNWGILNYYRNATVLGNQFTIDIPNANIRKATGMNGSIFLKKYLGKKDWLKGAYMGGGITLLNDKIHFQTNGTVTGVPTDRFIEAKNIGIRYKMGYQGPWIANSYFDFSLATGFNFKDNQPVNQFINHRYKKGPTGAFQLRLITVIHAKDTASQTHLKPNTIKGSIWTNPAAFFRNGIYAGAMLLLLPKTGTYGTMDGFYYANNNSNFNKYKIYGFQLGSRNYMNRECRGGYAGVFAGYNHLELQESQNLFRGNPFPNLEQSTKKIIKDQVAFGLQYGYSLRSSKNIFIDIGFHNGLRFGNKPFVSSNNVTFNFPNGTYTKLLIKVGAYID